jgi:hypothetical protein
MANRKESRDAIRILRPPSNPALAAPAIRAMIAA